ncbi:MAG: hypothetical protein QOI54_597 [Actinomycetota bacterium]|nr:hypothetical protein [Actinomycetota bacterium]
MRTPRLAVTFSAFALVVAAALMSAPTAGADDGHRGDAKRVRILDDCDPATFNEILGPEACVGNGDTTFDEFVAEFMAQGSVDKWRFKPDVFHVDAGDSLDVVNKGGEFHTFTEVPDFGGGCIPFLNGDLPVNPLCEQGDAIFLATGVPPGAHLDVTGLSPGRPHKFQCLIHPWMHAVVTVRADDHRGHD